uniref:Killer cell immunoglobulin-like receptor 3DL2 n=1 Tax=Anthurium amnicola TaxID=1678845 RepID=A0A1D1Z9Z7_9ARAE
MEGSRQDQQWRRREPSWWCTLLTQASLCVVLYVALNIGRPQMARRGNERGGDISRPWSHLDLYFMSVRGGSRPLEPQAQLLRQMENVARTFKADFIVNLSEHGDSDQLMQNATLHFPSLNVPWYATTASVEEGRHYFLRQIKVLHGQTLDIICLDTGAWQDSLSQDEPGDIGSDQLRWLSNTLAVTHSNWRVVVGFHSLADCKELHTAGKLNFCDHLHNIFLKYEVSAYLSNQGCGGDYAHEEGVTYIQNPSHWYESCGSCARNGSPKVYRSHAVTCSC